MLNLSFNFLKNIKSFIFPFYRHKELKFIFKKLQDGTPEGKIVARFVGGCVRKYLSNERIDDIDVATTLTTDQIKDFTEHFKRTHDIMGYEQYELCMECQDTFDSNEGCGCEETQPPQGSSSYFSSLVPEC